MSIQGFACRIFLSFLNMIGLMTHLQGSDSATEHNLSHEQRDESLQISLQKLIHKVKGRGGLPYISTDK